MSIARGAGLSMATCVFVFAACGRDEAAIHATPLDAGGSSSGASATSSSSVGDDDDSIASDGGGAGDPIDAGDAGPDPTSSLPPSCRATRGEGPGIDTCGASEAASDDCCASLTLPKTKTRTLDKYEITAGRMRAFVEAVPNIRQFATDFAKDHPESQLGKVATGFPAAGPFGGYLDTLPNGPPDPKKPLDEAVLLGAFPADALNPEDGCYFKPGGYGAATYWQAPKDLAPYSLAPRAYAREVLDTKALNCVSGLMLAAFCAWDGGELARTSDYHEIWNAHLFQLPGTGGATVFIPWNDVLPWSTFNWRNGHDGPCPPGWPGCVVPAQIFYSFPSPNPHPENDDSPEIAAPGRFPEDVTKAVSPDGGGWLDVGGNLMETAWPNTALVPDDKDFCDTSAGAGTVATLCNRDQSATDKRPGTIRYKGNTPAIVVVGYSFEYHSRRAENYLGSVTDDERLIGALDIKPAHFQYGKSGGRCVRTKK